MIRETSRLPSLVSPLLQPTRLTKACHRRLPSPASCAIPAAPTLMRLSRSRPYNKTATKHRAFLQCTKQEGGSFSCQTYHQNIIPRYNAFGKGTQLRLPTKPKAFWRFSGIKSAGTEMWTKAGLITAFFWRTVGHL